MVFSFLSFSFYNFMEDIKFSTDQCLFLSSAPTFDLPFPS